MSSPLIVRAPATSANLGPGFDCVGVALDLWNELEVTEGHGVEVHGMGAGELAADDSNLGVRRTPASATPPASASASTTGSRWSAAWARPRPRSLSV